MRAAAISAAREVCKTCKAREGLPRRRADSLDRLAAPGVCGTTRATAARRASSPCLGAAGAAPHTGQDHGRRAGRTGATTDDLHEQGRLRAARSRLISTRRPASDRTPRLTSDATRRYQASQGQLPPKHPDADVPLRSRARHLRPTRRHDDFSTTHKLVKWYEQKLQSVPEVRDPRS